MPKKKRKIKKKTAKKQKDYFSKIGDAFKNTKFDKRFVYTYLLDIAYYFSIITLIAGIAYSLFKNLENIVSTTTETSTILTRIMPALGIAALVGSLIYILVYTFLKGTIWRKVMRQKARVTYYPKLILLNIFLFLCLAILTLIGALTGPFIILFVIIMLYVVHIYYASLVLFTKENKLFYGIKQGIKKAWKFWFYIIPYLILLLISTASYLITNLFSSFMPTYALNTVSPGIVDTLELIQIYIQDFPKIIPFVILIGLITVFFRTYSRIFYAEFVQTQ